MSSGIEYEGLSSSTTMSSSSSHGITKAAESTFTQTESQKITITCNNDSNGVGLWQWVVSTSDERSKANTALVVCRYGTGLWNKMPDCPYTAC